MLTVVACMTCAVEGGEVRKWYDTTCKHKTVAEITGVEGRHAVLRKTDASIVRVPITKLYSGDQVYIEARRLYLESLRHKSLSPYASGLRDLDDLLDQVVVINGKRFRVVRIRRSSATVGIESLVVVDRELEEEIDAFGRSPTDYRIDGRWVSAAEVAKQRRAKLHEHYQTYSARDIGELMVVSSRTDPLNRGTGQSFRSRRPPSRGAKGAYGSRKEGGGASKAESSGEKLVLDTIHSVLIDPDGAEANRLEQNARKALTEADRKIFR